MLSLRIQQAPAIIGQTEYRIVTASLFNCVVWAASAFMV